MGLVTLLLIEVFPSGNFHKYDKVLPNFTVDELLNKNELSFSHWLSSLIVNCTAGLGDAAIVKLVVSLQPSALVTINETSLRPGVEYTLLGFSDVLLVVSPKSQA